MMDCIHARLLIVLQGRDQHELDAGARAALEAHLEQCADCLAWSSQESRVDDFIRQAVVNVPVPAALPSKILHALEGVRRPRRGLRTAAAAAAVLLLGLATAAFFWLTEKPSVTMNDFHWVTADREVATPESIQEWFAEMDLAMEVPRQFNFDHCNDYLIADIKGRRLPRLQYVVRGDGEAPPAIAHVYVVDRNRFSVDDIVRSLEQEQEPMVTSNHTIQALRDPGRFVYVVVFTGGNLQVFFNRFVG